MTMEKKVALITGANKGIGFEVARQLGEQGMIVLLGVRDLSRGHEAEQTLRREEIEAHAILLDVTDQATIDAAATHIEETYGRLDILVNNAGISVGERGTPPSTLTLEALRKTYETNVFGAFVVTKAMLPLLRRSENACIVNQSSQMGSLTLNSAADSAYATLPPSLAYNSSKTALNALTIFFSNELRATNIKVNSVCPGYCATDLNGHSGWQTAAQGAQMAVRFATLDADGPTGGFFDASGVAPW